MHTDASRIYNEQYIARMILGGDADQSISVAWPEGGGEDLARWVTYADSTKLVCRMFSFDPLERQVSARLFRIEPGSYEINLSQDRNGSPGEVLYAEEKTMMRMDTIMVTVPPKQPVILTVTQTDKHKDPGPLPDLAIADYDCERKDNSLTVQISNFGCAPSKSTVIRVYDERGEMLAEEKVRVVEAPVDFVHKSAWVTFINLPRKGMFRVVVDPDSKIREIFEGNNEEIVR